MNSSATSPIVTVRGEATSEVAPELATVSAAVNTAGSSSEQVTAELAAGSQRLADIVERFARAVEKSSTSGLWVHPVTDRRNSAKITGYRGSFSRQVVVHDFTLLSDLVLALAALPQTQVSGPAWSMRADSPAYREVRLAAIGDGRRRADDYAAAFGAHVDGLLEISDLEPGTGFPMVAGASFAAARSMGVEASFDFEPQLQAISGRVTLRFVISSPTLT